MQDILYRILKSLERVNRLNSGNVAHESWYLKMDLEVAEHLIRKKIKEGK